MYRCVGMWGKMGCPKIVLKGNLSEIMSNWQISIRYEDNQIMTHLYLPLTHYHAQSTNLLAYSTMPPTLLYYHVRMVAWSEWLWLNCQVLWNTSSSSMHLYSLHTTTCTYQNVICHWQSDPLWRVIWLLHIPRIFQSSILLTWRSYDAGSSLLTITPISIHWRSLNPNPFHTISSLTLRILLGPEQKSTSKALLHVKQHWDTSRHCVLRGGWCQNSIIFLSFSFYPLCLLFS